MNRVYSLAASAVLINWSLATAYGAPKAKNESRSAEAQIIFEHIQAQSATMADTASDLSEMARRLQDPDLHLQGLTVLRENVNKIGDELQSLEAERASLSEWEGKAFDQIVPLMQNAAVNAENALRNFNSDERHLWATSYVDETATVSRDAHEVAAILGNNLKLAKTKEKEARIEQSLKGTSGF